MAKALGATDVCLPSAGNAGSALAAYAARGGLKAHVFVPRDVAPVFVMETAAYGARGGRLVDGLITDAGQGLRGAGARENGWYECATLKEPYRVEGKKTMGYELAEQLGWRLPDAILYPTGGGTGLIGMWKAFAGDGDHGLRRPRPPADVRGAGRGLRAHREGVRRGPEDAPMWEDAHDARPRPARAQGDRRLPDPARAAREPRRGGRGLRRRDHRRA